MYLPVSAESTQGFSIPRVQHQAHSKHIMPSDRFLKFQAMRSVTLRTGSRTLGVISLFCLMHLNKCSEKVL